MVKMQIVEVGFVKKNNASLCSFLRKTSCSDGWLRLVVQGIFGFLIVTSFILIMLMAIGGPYRPKRPSSRCTINGCRVVCQDAPYYGNHEEDIIDAASEANTHCERIELQLNRPTFLNAEIPINFLSRIRASVTGLAIMAGNTRHIPPHTFITPFGNNLRTLILEDIEISVWENDMLVGLPNLKRLILKDCILGKIRNGALIAVDDTLKLLNIQSSDTWDPTNFTGAVNSDLVRLEVVDFSSNNFNNILRNTSFSKLRQCKILFLNSCKITSIGAGTFDHLNNLEVLYLNDNYLVTIPVGLFDKILPIKPRIALQDNFWHCDCAVNDLRTAFNKGLLIIDPICRFPDAVHGLPFSQFERFCQNNIGSNDVTVIPDYNNDSQLYPSQNTSRIFFIDAACHENDYFSVSLPGQEEQTYEQTKCMLDKINDEDLESMIHSIDKNLIFGVVDWIKPVYSVRSNHFSMVEIQASAEHGHGLLWYQSSCIKEISCVDFVPNTLKMYNVNSGIRYTFCPFNVTSGAILGTKCVFFNLEYFEQTMCSMYEQHAIILYILVCVGCLICGAIVVYALIQRNPALLKGNKRVIVVKHKSIEALILPPQLPKRNMTIDEPSSITKHVYEKQKLYLLQNNLDKLSPQNFIRSISTRSSGSNEASYISPLQPTEEQLREWRSNQIMKKFDNAPTPEVDTQSFSSIYERESLPYYTFHTTERVYEVPKQY